MTTLGAPLLSPPFAANGRIEIYGQRSACDGSDVTVARAMPAILEGRLSTSQWNKFCDDLDEALKPAAKMRKIFLAGMIVLPIIFVVFGAISFISFIVSSQNSFNNFPNNGGSSDFLGSFIFFIIGTVVMFVGFGILMCVAAKTRNIISTGLRKVCDETSARHPGVSFHVRYEYSFWRTGYGHHYDDYGYHNDVHVETTEYIEVYVADAPSNNVPTGVATAPIVAEAIPIPSAPPKSSYDPEVGLGGGAQKKTARERMQELDLMRSLLTEEEYQRKRAEIMSDV